MNKVAIIIPIHFPKRKFVKKLIKSYHQNQNNKYIDIYFILTDKNELTKYQKIIVNFNYLILPEKINHQNILKNKIYPSFKKFWALEYLTNTYDYQYLICIDSEILFLNLEKIYDICKDFCERKQVIGGIGNIKNINTQCLNFLKKFDDFQNIDTHIYFWFSQFPIYQKDITINFLKFIKFNENNYESIINLMDWYCFEYIIYIYYCIKFHNYQIINLNNYGTKLTGSLERKLNQKNLEIVRKNNFSINWQSNRHNTVLDEKIIMLYHLDTN